MKRKPAKNTWLFTTAVTAMVSMLLLGITGLALGDSDESPPPQVAISSIPLTVVIPAHPQVIIAVGNSNSMDSSDDITDDSNSNLTGRPPSSAIMTWSGTVGGGLQNSSSPVNYQIPASFTPPINLGSGGTAPYTPNIFSYSQPYSGVGGGYWGCSRNNTWTLVPASGGPTSAWVADYPPAPAPTWTPANPYQSGIYSPDPLVPLAAVNVPATERLANGSAVPYGISAVNPATMLLGLSNVGYLVGGNNHGGGAHPRATGSGPPAPPCGTGPGDSGIPCPPPPSCGPGSVPYVACPVTPPSCGPGSASGTPCEPPTYCVQWYWNPNYNYSGTNTWTAQGDNSPSRLNLAKASIAKVIQTYAGETDFGLLDYAVSGSQWNQTWTYYISPPSGFTFTNTYATPTPALQYVNNPCKGASGSGDCNQLAALYGSSVNTSQYMGVAASSDDPSIDDVFLTTNWGLFNQNIFTAYNNPNPSDPTPSSPYTAYTLGDYNSGGIQLTYAATKPAIGYYDPAHGYYGAIYTYPTNAGYVPYSPQVLFARRGWIQAGTVSSASGSMLVAVTSAGQNPTAAQIATYVQTFTPYLVPENNVAGSIPSWAPGYNNYTKAIFSNAGQSPIAGMLKTAYTTYTTGGGPPSSNGCTPPRYVILMTDGLPTMDLSGKNWPPLGSAAATGYGVTASFNADGSLNSTNNQAVQDAINELQALNSAGIKTFVVGLGAGVNPALNPQAAATLKAMAVAGGTNDYFAATSPAQVATDMQTILNTINNLNVSAVSAAVNTSGLNTGTVVYQASYTGFSQPYNDWTGNLQAFPINASTGVVDSVPSWSAQTQLDAQNWNTRVIATWNPASSTGVPFVWNDLSNTQQLELETSSTDTLGPNRLNYLSGDTSEEERNGGTFRNRSHILGDIVDSGPLYIGPPNGPYTSDPTYQTFEANEANRTGMIYAGANDGMLHAFDAATGDEKFAFVPNGVFPNLVNLSDPNYNDAHRYYVDGTPSAGDVKFTSGCSGSNCWHTILAGGLNDGGNSIYALDITNPSGVTTESQLASRVLWEFTDSDLGLTYSKPVIADTNAGFMVIFGSGYNNSNGNDYLYAVKPQTGALVKRINLCAAVSGACSSTLPNGLSSPVVVNSGGTLGQPANTVYAGDLQGNLWKVDISDPDPDNWTVSLLFQAQDSSGNPQPITVTPAVSLAPNFPSQTGTVVYFGTGEYLGPPDLTNTQTQSFYAVWDKPGAGTATLSQLQQQTLSTTSVTIGGQTMDVRTVTDNTVNWNTKRGWYMNLPLAGERVVTNPQLFNGEVVFTTYVPSAGDTCFGGGAAFLMAVNYKNGSSFPQPQLDINGDGMLNSSDQVDGQNPVGLGLGKVFASAPTILSANLGDISAVKLTTLSTGQIMNVGERGGQSGRASWWQIP